MKAVIQKIWHWDAAKLGFFLFVIFGSIGVFSLTPSLFPSALISVLLYFIFTPIVDAVERKGIARTTGILGIFILCGTAIGLVMTTVVPRISHEVDSFQQGSARYAHHVSERLRDEEKKILGRYPMFKNANFSEKIISWTGQSIDRFIRTAPDFATQLFICLLLVPFFTFVLLKDAHEIRRSLLKLVPNRYFETVYGLTARILEEMGGYVAARVIEAVLVMALVTIGCLALKIPYAILFGAFAGATNAIPYLGPLMGALPGLILAVLEPAVPNQLLWMTGIYLVANLIDMIVIFPLVVAKIVDLHPIVVVIAVMIGSQIFGVVGMIVAVPITSIFKILIQEVYSRVYSHSESTILD